MKRLAKLAMLGSCLLVLIAPVITMVHPFVHEEPLGGVVPPEQREPLSLHGVWTEHWQAKLRGWFEQSYGFKPSLVRLDNSIGYYALHETRPDKTVRIGEGDWLFLAGQVDFDNQTTDARESVIVHARKIRAAQDALAARGKVLVFMILPSKTSLFPEKMPTRWVAPLGSPRPWQTMSYEPFVAELERTGALFVDGPRLLAPLLHDKPDVLYSQWGRHLNPPASCLVLEAALALARPRLPDKTIPPLDCSYDMKPVRPWSEELDLFRLLNVWAPTPAVDIPTMRAVPDTVPLASRADVLVVGSSFGGRTIREIDRNHTFGTTHFFYYNASVEVLGQPLYPLPKPGSAEWRALALSKDLILLPVPQEFIPSDGAFLDSVIEALAH